ncbi:MAG: ROK family protein [Melioribacteraceae bacterium]|nr:ROK family protein [Melioribacteraceae bacterium]
MGTQRYAIGVDLGGTSIKFGLVNELGKIKNKFSLETNAAKGPQAVIDQIIKGIAKLNDSKYKIIGIGIGTPGVVTKKKGTVENPPNFPGWERISLGSILKTEFKKKVFVENDANAAAIGEMIFGSGKKYKNFIMITLGTGVGGGIIINRKIYRGESGGAGEIGHVSINEKGKQCKCGSRGCIETYAGNNYLIEQVKKELPNHKDSKLHQLISEGNELNPKLIHDAYLLNDSYAEMIIVDLAQKLGAALASIINVLDIPKVIIGGGVAGFGRILFDTVEATIKQRVMKPISPRIIVKPAKLKNEAGIKGASALVFYKS